MQKRYTIIFAALASCFILLNACTSKETTEGLTPVTLNEVAHSIFYAPMYVAIEEG